MKKIPVIVYLLILPFLAYAQQPEQQIQDYSNDGEATYQPVLNANQEPIWYPVNSYNENPNIPPPGAIGQQNPEAFGVQESSTPSMPQIITTCCFHNSSFEFRVADYIPLSSKMRRIYASGIPFYQLEASYSYNGPVSGWMNVGFLRHSGRSRGKEDRTYLRMVPIGLGLKYSFFLPYCWEGYVGAGPTYTFLRIHDHSRYNEHTKRGALGAVVKAGLTYQFWKCVQLDLFADYFYTRFHFSGNRHCVRRTDFDASGVSVGAGIGFLF